MLPQFDRDVFDISPDKTAKVDNLHIPDLPMLHFPQNLIQNKKYSYHVTYHVTPKSSSNSSHITKVLASAGLNIWNLEMNINSIKESPFGNLDNCFNCSKFEFLLLNNVCYDIFVSFPLTSP